MLQLDMVAALFRNPVIYLCRYADFHLLCKSFLVNVSLQREIG